MTSIQERVALTSLTTFGCPSLAEHFIEVHSLEELRAAVHEAHENHWKIHVLGAGANTIARSWVEGLVIRVALKGIDVTPTSEGALLTVGAGELFQTVIDRMLALGFSGLENLTAIPGTVGGAVVQNIGAYGVELAEHLVSVRVYDCQRDEELVLTAQDCDFAYRHSVFKKPKASQWIILSAVLRVQKAFTPVISYKDVEQSLVREGLSVETLTATRLSELIREIRARKLPDPQVIGNAGSFFMNPIVNKVHWRRLLTTHPSLVSYKLGGARMKIAAAWLIEEAGFKGWSDGKVGVYDKQALILVNKGAATGEDVLRLAKTIQERVQAQFGVQLKMEPVVL